MSTVSVCGSSSWQAVPICPVSCHLHAHLSHVAAAQHPHSHQPAELRVLPELAMPPPAAPLSLPAIVVVIIQALRAVKLASGSYTCRPLSGGTSSFCKAREGAPHAGAIGRSHTAPLLWHCSGLCVPQNAPGVLCACSMRSAPCQPQRLCCLSALPSPSSSSVAVAAAPLILSQCRR